MVRIRAFQARGPGSIPGRRKKNIDFLFIIAIRGFDPRTFGL